MASFDHSAFNPTQLGNLTLKNHFIRAGCFEGMCQNGQVTDNLIAHHQALAEGGLGMTTVAYCSVSHDGRTFDHELWMREEIVPDLRRLTDAVHASGAKASIQLGHSGFFTNRSVIGKRPLGASPKLCVFTRAYCRQMTEADIAEKTQDFVNAATLAKSAGFDAVEIHAGHGYLLSQFLSPWTNKRQDQYGGTLENRLRFPVEVIRAVREALGSDFPILVKMNQLDGMPVGIKLNDAVIIAQAFESAGATALIPSAGFTSKVPFLMLRGNLPITEMSANQPGWVNKIGLTLFGRYMVPEHPYEPLFLLEGADAIRKSVDIPVIYIGGTSSLKGINEAWDKGFKFFQLGRATIQNPNFINDLASKNITASACDHCNRCVAAMDGGGVYCVSNKIGFLEQA